MTVLSLVLLLEAGSIFGVDSAVWELPGVRLELAKEAERVGFARVVLGGTVGPLEFRLQSAYWPLVTEWEHGLSGSLALGRVSFGLRGGWRSLSGDWFLETSGRVVVFELGS